MKDGLQDGRTSSLGDGGGSVWWGLVDCSVDQGFAGGGGGRSSNHNNILTLRRTLSKHKHFPFCALEVGSVK